MCSQFRPTATTGEWRSGNAVAQLGPLTKMAISAGSGWLNRSRILPVESQLSYRHLRQRSVASRCRSAEVLRKDGGDKRLGVVSPVEAAACRAVARAKAGCRLRPQHLNAGDTPAATATDSPLNVGRWRFDVSYTYKQKRPAGFPVEAAVPAAIVPHATRPFGCAQGTLCHHSKSISVYSLARRSRVRRRVSIRG